MSLSRFSDVLMCEDIPFCQIGIEISLRRALPEMRELRKAEDGEQALRLVKERMPDLALLDLGLPDISGLQVIRDLRALSSEIKILVITGSDDAELLRQVTLFKVNGVLHKSSPPLRLQELLESIAQDSKSPALDVRVQSILEKQSQVRLTAREYQVLEGIISGLTNPQIAEQLKCSVETVRFHRSNIMDKTDIHNTAELTAWFLKGHRESDSRSQAGR